MAEKTITICDVCGKPSAETVAITVGKRRILKDLCVDHLNELMSGARAPRRGRRPRGQAAAPTSPRRTQARGAAGRTDAVSEARRLRDQGLSYREIGDALMKRGIKPPRAKVWNRVVIGRMVQRTAG